MGDLKKRASILCFAHLPPPVHGVTLMGQIVVTSQALHTSFQVDILPLHCSQSIEDIGRFRLGKFIKIFRLAWDLFQRCLTIRPDLVYFTLAPTGSAFYRDLLFVAILKITGSSHVYHLHGKGIARQASGSFLKKQLYRWAFGKAQVIHLSPKLYSDISQFVPKNKCHFLANGIPDSADGFKSAQVRKSADKTLCILYFSNMMITKGPLVLLEALVNLKRRGESFHALFAGGWASDGCAEQFSSIVRENELQDFVEYLGPKYGSDKSDLYRKADIFVFPTYNDAFPLVLLEAMSYGLPVISTFEGAIPDIVQDNVTGFLIPPKDPESLTSSLSVLLNNHDLRFQFGQAGRKRFIECFTQDTFEINLVSTIEKCLNGKGNREMPYGELHKAHARHHHHGGE
ncbi:MAG: glycosyltransferase family 4 protein [bacterium]